MQNKVYVHVGMSKAGSSSIQKSLYQNKKILFKNNYFVPTSDSKNLSGDHLKIKSVRIASKKMLKKNILLKDRNLLLSNELIFSNLQKWFLSIQKLFTSYNVKIIYCVRAEEFRAESLFIQMIATNFPLFRKKTSEVFRIDCNKVILERRNCNSLKNVERHLDTFGVDNVRLIPFDKKKLEKESLISRFYRAVDIDMQKIGIVEDSSMVNTSESKSNIFVLAQMLYAQDNTVFPMLNRNILGDREFNRYIVSKISQIEEYQYLNSMKWVPYENILKIYENRISQNYHKKIMDLELDASPPKEYEHIAEVPDGFVETVQKCIEESIEEYNSFPNRISRVVSKYISY